MVNRIGVVRGGNQQDFQGLSGDEKPVDGGEHNWGRIGGMSSFYESDTKKVWIYDAKNINPATTDGWWG